MDPDRALYVANGYVAVLLSPLFLTPDLLSTALTRSQAGARERGVGLPEQSPPARAISLSLHPILSLAADRTVTTA